jgi:release factor glutamine methyltransferase
VRIDEELELAREGMRAAGVPDPSRDAELLLRHVLGWDRARLLVSAREELAASHARRYRALWAQRATRRPLQHLTGTQAFWRHDFLVTPDVLIPRPETEHLVETALDWLRGRDEARIVDVGTGTGCIALSVAAERRDARVAAIDISPAALDVACANRTRLGVSTALVLGDLLAPVAVSSLDLVLSNPPYVEADELQGLEPEVRDHDPRLALVPPQGWRALYARLARESASCLRSGGALAVEVGAGQSDEVVALLAAAGLRHVRTVADLSGTPRVVLAERA